MSANLITTTAAAAEFVGYYPEPGVEYFDEPEYSAAELSAYCYDLEGLLDRVEKTDNHYNTLGVDYLATTGDLTTGYLRAMVLLDPESYGLTLPMPEGLRDRAKAASDQVSDAFRTLIDLDEKLEYDGCLFGHGDSDNKKKDSRTQRRESKRKINKEEETAAQKEANRRTRERFDVSIPAEVTGYDKSSKDWHEVVQTVDLSRSGACILLRKRVIVGKILYLRMAMPVVLRTHDYLDQTYGTYAVVRWIKPPRDGFRAVGVEFVGQLPPPGFRERPWAAFHLGQWKGPNRRAEERENITEVVEIEYFDESERVIKRDSGLIENISASGVRVCGQDPPECADLIRIIRPKVSWSIFAIVRNRFKGRDGYERLCAQFIKETLMDDTVK